MANKTTARAMPRGAKTNFVLTHITKRADEIVALAKQKGIVISPGVVHSIRSVLRKQGFGPQSEAVQTAMIRRVGHAPPPPNDKRAALRRLIVQVGYDAALAELDRLGKEIDKGTK